MADKLTPQQRSENMRRIKSTGTKPELAVRRLLHSLGYRYRLHGKGLPGKPDLVFTARSKIVFVHGCFWHGHDACAGGHSPQSNQAYWSPKLERTRQRDMNNAAELSALGWEVFTVWECEVDTAPTADRLRCFLGPPKRVP